MIRSLLHRVAQKTWEWFPSFFYAARKIGVPERVWRHLYFDGDLSISVNETASFRIHHYGYRIENEFFWAGFGNTWEATSLQLWCLLARRAEAIFDIGANTGVYALSAKSVNPSARVYAFEPVPRVHERLQNNINLNSWDIKAVRAGISEQTGTATLYEGPGEQIYSASLEVDADGGPGGVVQTEIKTYRMLDFLSEVREGGVDLVKIDTEKHELAVLSGFGDLIEKKRPIIMIEVLDGSLGDVIEGFFCKSTYVFYEIREGQGAFRTESLGRSGRNYLICPFDIAAWHDFGASISHDCLREKNAGTPNTAAAKLAPVQHRIRK